MAIVKDDYKDGYVCIEQRNRFKVGDVLEVLSPNDTFNKKIEIQEMKDEKGDLVDDASLVQQILYLKTDVLLKKGDILRK
jgi:putative protease